jgi:hypothetical protein
MLLLELTTWGLSSATKNVVGRQNLWRYPSYSKVPTEFLLHFPWKKTWISTKIAKLGIVLKFLQNALLVP